MLRFLYHMKDHLAQFCKKKIGMVIAGGDPFYVEFWDKLTPLEQKHRFQSIIARSALAVTPNKKFNKHW